MAQSVEEQIAERKAIADEQMQHQGYFARLFNRTGLAAANGTQRVTSTWDSDIFAFTGGAILGAVRGGVLGGVAGLVLLALDVPGISVLAVAAVGMTAFALYHGYQAAHHHHMHRDDKRLADRIAERTGAVPEQVQSKEAEREYEDEEHALSRRPRYAQDIREQRERGHGHGHSH